MDPFARKMISGMLAFAGALLIFAGVLAVFYFHDRPQCGDQVISETASPDGRWKAAVMQRRCGEESPFFVHVNLRPAKDPVQRGFFSGRAEAGEVFLLEQESPEAVPQLGWTSPAELTLRCSQCRDAPAQKHEERWGPIEIRYQLQR